MVSDLILDNHTWDTELLKKLFGEEEVKTIKTVHLVSSSKEDEFSWEKSSHGDYLTK